MYHSLTHMTHCPNTSTDLLRARLVMPWISCTTSPCRTCSGLSSTSRLFLSTQMYHRSMAVWVIETYLNHSLSWEYIYILQKQTFTDMIKLYYLPMWILITKSAGTVLKNMMLHERKLKHMTAEESWQSLSDLSGCLTIHQLFTSLNT